MNKVRLACGHRTENPYFFDKMMVKVYSPEELCYCIMLDAYLLDDTFATEELAAWLGNECGLPELESRLRTGLRNKCTVDEFAGMILDHVGFYSSDIIEETCNVIRDNASKTLYEKNLARADYYLMCGHVMLALAAYTELLETIPEREKTVRSCIWHNCGFAYAKLFRFNEAARAYYCSYRTLPTDDALKQFLTALRIAKTDEKYLEYISGHPEFYEMSQKVERNLAAAEGQFEGTDEYRMLVALKVLREDGAGSDGSHETYYDRLDELADTLKTSYREMVSK